ncbi:hypothetical protein H1R20_g14180, partial [Candolleomyces eurysporus]
MLYDKNPPYPHYDHLPYAKEPWKSLYVLQRLTTTLAMVPWWATYYTVMPKSIRPRSSWNLRQIIYVNFTRRVFKVTEVAGVTWGTRDPTTAPNEAFLKETSFEWVEPLRQDLRTGILKEEESAPYVNVGCYIWPKKTNTKSRFSAMKDSLVKTDSNPETPPAQDDRTYTVGIYMHGGGYCHMSAHESSRTSRIPRGLVQRGILDEVYAVEYRLLQVAPFPAVVQDAAAVYSHVVNKYTQEQKKFKIVLVGDSSGGNLALSLARWLRDEGKLPSPDGMILLSPSCDTSHNLPETLSSYIPRPNEYSDYLVDNPEPRALLQRTFLGFKGDKNGPTNEDEDRRLMQVAHSEYVSPCSPVVLERWGHSVQQDPEGEYRRKFWRYTLPNLPDALQTFRHPEVLNPMLRSWDDLTAENPYRKTCQFPGLFAAFPRTIIVCGDGERLVREVRALISAMTKDGVDITTHWAPDACHDALMISETWWDKAVLDNIWQDIDKWASALRSSDKPTVN